MIKVKTVIVLFTTIFIFSLPNTSNAQFWNKLKKHVEKKVEKEAEKRTNRKADEAVDKAFDTVEEGAEGAVKGEGDSGKKTTNAKKNGEVKKSKSETNSSADESNSRNDNSASNESKTHKPKIKWAKYDFVPGDKVIFEDGPSVDEENGEFPSRWDLESGQVEIAEVDGEPVMIFLDGSPAIIPYLKNSKEDYLPEIFTIEFDFYKPKNGNRISVYLYDVKNQKSLLVNDERNMYMDIDGNSTRMHIGHNDNIDGVMPGIDNHVDARWIHVSIAYTKGKLKVYMDDTRVINIPHYSENPKGLTLQAYWADAGDNKAFYFKNVRIAKGGVKYYDRFLSDGKIIVNGIRFDVNKATIKPESNGAINKIFKLMKKYSDVKFSIEGHTDGDGDDNHNLQLSEKRAESVMNRLISLGINADRLEFKGLGESKPLDNNTTAEGKANNRRVEFVKI